jgi:hypothetical protein
MIYNAFSSADASFNCAFLPNKNANGPYRKWRDRLQSIIFHSRLIMGIGTDVIIPIWPGEKWLGIPEMPKGA